MSNKENNRNKKTDKKKKQKPKMKPNEEQDFWGFCPCQVSDGLAGRVAVWERDLSSVPSLSFFSSRLPVSLLSFRFVLPPSFLFFPVRQFGESETETERRRGHFQN